jgi:hypothetical protein
VVTALQPQPPGTQVPTTEVNWPKPLSKPSLTGVVTPQLVAVAVGVEVAGTAVVVRGGLLGAATAVLVLVEVGEGDAQSVSV